jgi:hypothetical protein
VNATKTRRLVPTAAAAVLLAVPALSSCGVSFGAQTDQYYTPTDGENNREGTVQVIDAIIISEEPGSGRLIAALANSDTENDDALTSVQGVGVDQSVQFTLEEGDTTIPAGGVLQLADDGSAVVAVNADPQFVTAGGYVRVAFTFERGEAAEVNVPVLAPGETYADIEIPEAAPAGAGG